jgi:hypothetical protein
MLAVVLKNFVLFLMLLLMCHYTIVQEGGDVAITTTEAPFKVRKTVVVEEEEDVEEEEPSVQTTKVSNVPEIHGEKKELYDFVFEDTDASKTLNDLYDNHINVARVTCGDPDSLDCVTSKEAKPGAEVLAKQECVSGYDFETIGAASEQPNTLTSGCQSGGYASKLFTI